MPDDGSKENEALYDKKVMYGDMLTTKYDQLMPPQVEDLERILDAPLHVVYLKQLSLLREKSLKTFKQALTSEGTEFEAMMQADEFYRKVTITIVYESQLFHPIF